MKNAGKSILTAIVMILIVGVLGFLLTNGLRLIDEHNSVQKEAKLALEDYLSTGKELPVGEYVSYEVRWVLGPFATETKTQSTNGIKATSGEMSYYFLFLEEPDGLSIMALEAQNVQEVETLNHMSDWLADREGFPYGGSTLKVQGKLREMKDAELLRLYKSDLLSIFGLSSNDPAVRYLILDTTAGREGPFLIVAGAAVAILLIVLIRNKAKKKAAATAAAPVSYSYDPERKA